MRAAPGLLLLLLLLLLRGSGHNVMAHEPDVPVVGILSARWAEASVSGADYEETEEEDMKALLAPPWLGGDSGRVESQLKKPALSETGKKNPDKPKKGARKGKKKKKKNRPPCEGIFKNFCIHGECKYIEHLQIPTCKCHPNYYGERCVEQFLKSHRSNEAASQSTTILVVVAVVFSVFSFAVLVVIVVMWVRKKYPKCEETEEKKKLRQENGSSSNERIEERTETGLGLLPSPGHWVVGPAGRRLHMQQVLVFPRCSGLASEE